MDYKQKFDSEDLSTVLNAMHEAQVKDGLKQTKLHISESKHHME